MLQTYFAKRSAFNKLHRLKIAFAAVKNVFDFDTPFQVLLNLLLELQGQEKPSMVAACKGEPTSLEGAALR